MLNKEKAAHVLEQYFKKHKFAKMMDLSNLLDTHSRMSVFRRLRDFHYLSSYTHAGTFYTLPEIAQFNRAGLWLIDSVGFSQHGNLKETLVHLIVLSDAGKTQNELQIQLQIRVHNALLELFRQHQIHRERIDGTYVYVSHDPQCAKAQLARRAASKIGWGYNSQPDWLVMEVLVAIIQCNQMEIDAKEVMQKLQKKGVRITDTQLEEIFVKFNLKKTSGFQQ